MVPTAAPIGAAAAAIAASPVILLA
jgi:hypothetical protein